MLKTSVKSGLADQKRLSFLRAFLIILGVLSFVLTLRPLTLNNMAGALFIFISAILMLVMRFFLRHPKNLRRISGITCMALSISIMIAAISGKNDIGPLLFYPAINLLAFFLLGRTRGILFGAFNVGLIVLLAILQSTGTLATTFDTSIFGVAVMTIILPLAILYSYEGINLSYERLILEREESLAKELERNSTLTQALRKEKASVEAKVVQRTAELHDAQIKLLSSIESMSIGFMLVNADGKILIKNGALTRIFEGNPLTHLHEIDLTVHEMQLEAYFKASDRTQKADIDRVVCGAKILHIFMNPVRKANESDSLLGTVMLFEDITEARVLERSKDEFFSIASHELRTPLTAIKGNASMMMQMYPEVAKDAGLKEMVDDILNSSSRLIAIVHDFLDMSRIEQGKMVFKLQAVPLHEILESVVQEMSAVLQEKSLTIQTVQSADQLSLLPHAYADPDRSKQVIYNLVGNAVKFTERGSISLDLEVQGDFIRVLVTDTGRGIALEGRKLLFHKFQQTASSILTRDTMRGTGLGLYISKLLVEGMHGEIGLKDTVPGKGSTFYFTLPIYSGQTSAQSGIADSSVL